MKEGIRAFVVCPEPKLLRSTANSKVKWLEGAG